MKNQLAIIFLLFTTCLSAQNNFDIIVKHSDEHLSVQVISVDEKITFNYQNETVTNSISKNCVKEIIFSSGRIQVCSEKIIVNSVEDWEKVIITNNPEDVKCLVRKGDITASASNTWNFKSKSGVDRKATAKIKKEAAELKAHIVLIQSQEKENSFWSGASSSKNGVAYGYQ